MENGASATLQKDSNTKLIISYSLASEKKDNANREKGIAKLEKQIEKGKLTKAQINNKGCNKFLKMNGEIKIRIA